ncbi:MAG: ABC transporter ATP-binding protein [Pseudomonadota bacterium]
MDEAVLSVRGLSKRFGAVEASCDVSLDVREGEIHALIGPNGAGKSTLIGQIAGGIAPDSGAVLLRGEDVTHLDTVARARRGLGRSFQVSAVVPGYSVRDNILLALQGRDGRGFRLWAVARARDARLDEVAEHAARVRLETRLGTPAADLSHGERRRLELAMALALRPKVFLLDEPMAGLGNEGAAELTELLAQLKHEAPILLVEHDMDAVFALADRISVLVYGRVIATGSVEEIRANTEVRRAYLGDEEDAL